MLSLSRTCILALLLAATWALPQESDYGNYEYPEEVEEEVAEDVDYNAPHPKFLVEPQNLKAKEGEGIIIPCQHSETPYVLTIKKEETDATKDALLFFVDKVKVRRERRYKLKDNQMEISSLRRSDAGTYTCRLESVPPVEISHVLKIEYSPTITAVIREKRVHKGDIVRLECLAGGNPPPTITWSRQEGRMPTGTLEEEGLSITLVEVDRHVEGKYVCTAENGIGEPSSDVISVIVEYPPEIITEKDMVQTSEGETVELVCIVHARPAPRIEWTKDGKRLPLDSHIQEKQNGGHHNAIRITQLSEADFGEYVCTAENKFGVVESTINLTGTPKAPHFTSSPNGGEENSYTLTWNTESYYPITAYRLKYRKAKINEVTKEPGEWVDGTHEVKGNVETNGLVHTMKHTLNFLEAATDYTAVVQIKNQYVWGDSASFSFSTRKVPPTTTTTTPIPITTTTFKSTSTMKISVWKSEGPSKISEQELAQPTKIGGASIASISKILLLGVSALVLSTL